MLLLSSKDESRSTGERALSVAKALDAAVDRARVGQAVAFEAREEPGDLRGARRSARPAAEGPAAGRRGLRDAPGPARPRRAADAAGARAHWAALLTDTVAIGTSGAKPQATADLGPPWSLAFTQLRAALPWQYGSGVASARVVAASPELRRKLREAALRVP